MPLAHDVAVVLIHDRPETLCNPDDRFQRLNERVFEQSKEIAAHGNIKLLKRNCNLVRSS